MATSLSCNYEIDMSHLSSLFKDKLSIYLWEGKFSQPRFTKLELDSQITVVELISDPDSLRCLDKGSLRLIYGYMSFV